MVYFYPLLLLCSWFAPLHILPWAGWHQEVMVFALVLLMGWHFLFGVGRQPSVAIPMALIPLAGLGLVATAQWLAGLVLFGGDALVLGFYLMLIGICFTVGFSLAGKLVLAGRVLLGLAVVILLGSAGSIVIALAQVFEVWEDQSWVLRIWHVRRPGGNLGQPNHLATLLLMGLVSLNYLYEFRRLGKTLAILLLTLLMSGLALTESRTGILSFFLLSVWWLVKRRTVAFTVPPLVILSSGLGLIFLLWAWPQVFAFVHSGGFSDGANAEPVSTSAGARFIVWPQLVEAILQRPWFGWGLGQVTAAHNAVLHSYSHSEPFSYAHNILLDLAVGAGLPLALLLTAAMAYWLWKRVQKVQNLATWSCLAFALPLGVHSMLEYPFAYGYLLAPAVFALGLLEGALASRHVLHLAWRAAATTMVVATALMVWSVFEYLAIEDDFRVARFEAMRVGETPADYVRPRIFLLTQLSALVEDARITPVPGMSADQIELTRKAALRFPWTATQNRYALTLALNGNPQEAVRQLKVIRAMHGEKHYERLKDSWHELAETRYSQLAELPMP